MTSTTHNTSTSNFSSRKQTVKGRGKERLVGEETERVLELSPPLWKLKFDYNFLASAIQK
jgi:hypothetical protein